MISLLRLLEVCITNTKGQPAFIGDEIYFYDTVGPYFIIAITDDYVHLKRDTSSFQQPIHQLNKKFKIV